MTVNYDALVPALNKLLPSRRLAVLGRLTGFIQRLRAIRASAFVWATVLSRFEPQRPGFSQARHWYKRLTGRSFCPRPFQMRFKSPTSVEMFAKTFDQAVSGWRAPRRISHPLARHFSDIVAWDSTVMQVADELRRRFRGTRNAVASLKVCLGISLFGLLPLCANVVAGSQNDMRLFPPLELFKRATLFVFDKGFVGYRRLRELTNAGHFYVCRLRQNGNPLILAVHHAPSWLRKKVKAQPGKLRLRDLLAVDKRVGQSFDLEVQLEAKHAGPTVTARLVIVPGPDRCQRAYLTNLASAVWSPRLVTEVYRLRWQIELVFKELKQHLSLGILPSKDPHAVQIFAWASLIALALSRVVAGWLLPLRRLVGLKPILRPHLVTRALRPSLRILGRALVAPLKEALWLLRLLSEALLEEARPIDPGRTDSFHRLAQLLSAP
jgi:putative transposase